MVLRLTQLWIFLSDVAPIITTCIPSTGYLARHMRSLQGIMVPVVPVPAAAGNQSNEFEEVMQSLTKLSLS